MKPISTTKKRASSPDEAPRVTTAQFATANFRVAGRAASREAWQAAVRARLGTASSKRRISIMLDAPIIEHFRAAAGERGYQTLINDTLRRTVEGQQLLTELRAEMRAMLREELAHARA